MTIIVTGAAGVLGRAVVRTLERAGQSVVAVDQHVSPVDGSARAPEIAADLSDGQATRKVIDGIASEHPEIRGVVHLVGAFRWIPVAEASQDDWWSLHVANVGTALNVINSVTPHLTAGASIVCVGASSAQPARAGMAPYGAAKSGVARLVEALAEELRPRSIRVNAVAPGIIDTPRNRSDMPNVDPSEWTTPEAISDVIAFLASDQARAINGAIIPVTNNV